MAVRDDDDASNAVESTITLTTTRTRTAADLALGILS